MAQAFLPRDFLRRAPNQMLRRYFEERSVFADLDWATLTETKIEPLYEAWLELDEDLRNQMVQEFQEIALLATEGGKLAVLDEAEFHGEDQELHDQLAKLDDYHACAFWAFFERQQYWPGAVRFTDADNRPRRYWRKRINLPPAKGPIEQRDGQALAEALSDLLFKREARGRHCTVELYRRGEREYFFAYPEDHRQTAIEWDGGHLEKRPHTPAFEIIFVHNDGERSINIWWRGSAKLVPDLQVIFARSALGSEIERESRKDTRVYDLSPLMSDSFQFQHDPALGIESATVRRIRVIIFGEEPEKIIVEVGPKAPPSAIYDLLAQATQGISPSRLRISQVGIRATFAPEPGAKRGRTCSFDVSWPNSCSLQNEGRDLNLQQMLSQSGIEPKEPAEKANEAR